jgi:hypothetical protein
MAIGSISMWQVQQAHVAKVAAESGSAKMSASAKLKAAQQV